MQIKQCLYLALAMIVVYCSRASAQSSIQPRPGFFNDYHLSDLLKVPFTPAYDADEKAWNKRGLLILGGGALATYLSHELGDDELSPASRARILGGSAKVVSNIGDVYPYVVMGGLLVTAPFLALDNPYRQYTFDSGIQLAFSLLLTTGVTTALKLMVGRTRPDGSNDLSFPSGHSSLTFAAAGTLAYRYPWYVGALSLSSAALTAFSRVDLRKHYLSDTVAGATLGLAFASGVEFFYQNRQKKIRAEQKKLSFTPLFENGSYGLTLTSSF